MQLHKWNNHNNNINNQNIINNLIVQRDLYIKTVTLTLIVDNINNLNIRKEVKMIYGRKKHHIGNIMRIFRIIIKEMDLTHLKIKTNLCNLEINKILNIRIGILVVFDIL